MAHGSKSPRCSCIYLYKCSISNIVFLIHLFVQQLPVEYLQGAGTVLGTGLKLILFKINYSGALVLCNYKGQCSLEVLFLLYISNAGSWMGQ